MTRVRWFYLIAAIIVIAVGILSRMVQTGSPLFDKYLGDALYAVLIYLILAIVWPRSRMWLRAVVAMTVSFAVEVFQLTGIPAELIVSSSLPVKLLGIALGTKFHWLDVLAYSVGVMFVFGADALLRSTRP